MAVQTHRAAAGVHALFVLTLLDGHPGVQSQRGLLLRPTRPPRVHSSIADLLILINT